MNASTFRNVSVKDIAESKTNPRGTSFQGPEFNDLVASIKEKGILVPLIIRPVGKGYEVVAGSRRFRAAQQLKLAEVPASIQELTDSEAQEVQIIENLQRADVHPVDEATAYRVLILDRKMTVKDISIAVGKSEAYVRDRILLTNLIPAAAKAYRSGELGDGHALLIAKLSEKDQTETLKYALDKWDRPTVADLKRHIDFNYHSPMERQPWLKSKTFSCKHTKECQPNGSALFGEMKAGACTDLACWQTHMNEWIAFRMQNVMGMILIADTYARPDVKGSLTEGQWKEAKGKKDACKYAIPAIYSEGHSIGRETEVCIDAACKKHWKDASPAGRMKLTPEEKEARKKEKEEEAAKEARDEKELMDAVARVKFPLSEAQIGALLNQLISGQVLGHQAVQTIAERLGIKDAVSIHVNDLVIKKAKTMTPTEQARIIFEFVLRDDMFGNEYKQTLKSL